MNRSAGWSSSSPVPGVRASCRPVNGVSLEFRVVFNSGAKSMPDDVTSPATELHWLTIADAARLIERRRILPLELTDALIARIETLDPQINAFLLPTPEKAREQARAAEREIMAANYRWPAAWRSVRAEGHLLHRQHPHHQPLAPLRGLCPHRRRHAGHAALSGRRGPARQAGDPRVRAWRPVF